MKPVLVIWDDAVSDDEWVDGEAQFTLDPHTIYTLGWLLSEDCRNIIVALSLDTCRGASSQRLSIPQGMVKEIRHLPGLGDF